MRSRDTFPTIHVEGGLLPAQLLARIAALDKTLAALSPDGYHLAEGERLNEAINRSWNRLTGAWERFRDTLAREPDDDPATNPTRRWVLTLFQELGYGQLQPARAVDIGDKTYAISHAWGPVPVHVVGARLPIDRRSKGVRGAAAMSPHGLVQEYLNRSDDHLWGFVSNGLQLRMLRDNAALTRQAYVEVDLDAMFTGRHYADFALVWLLAHQSRLEGDPPEKCVLEQWTADAAREGVRALDQLRSGVERAITELGTGFVAHPANTALRDALRTGALDRHDFYRELLRLVYRLLFLFVAESRDLLLVPHADPTAAARYREFYSLARLRQLAERRRGSPHGDLWAQLTVVFDALGRPEGLPALGLPGLGSFLWSDEATPHLRHSQLANRHLLAAVLALSSVHDGKVRRSVDYRNLGSEELGSVYESLLELHPDVSVEERTFTLATAAGNERKSTGSYYTPTSLITALLDTALDPVLDEAVTGPDPETALLELKVLDPACGSGHFLIAAAHRIARRLAAIRTGDDEPSPEALRTALRDVVGRCLHGIDVNPMAVELCKVSLWMEAMEPGKPLRFLEHRIVCGNALLGATPELLAGGVPDDAFKPLTGDDKAVVASLRKRNKASRHGQGELFAGHGTDLTSLADLAADVDATPDDTPQALAAKAQRWADLLDAPEYRAAVHAAHTWCAAFVAPKTAHDPAITHAEYRTACEQPGKVRPEVRKAVEAMVEQYRFLHWHLAFLDVYGPQGRGGFDVVLGNPPWEKVKLSEKEFFAARAPEVASLAGAKRKAAIAKLQADDPALWRAYQAERRRAEGESHLLRSTGRYPLCGRGDVNTYAVFAEAMRSALAPTGRLGIVVPTGIATDDTTRHFFADCVAHARLVSLSDFENTKKIFPAVDSRMKFCLLTLTGGSRPVPAAEFAFFAHDTADLADPERRFTLTPDDIALINPNTRTAPVFRTRRDAEITKGIYRRVPVLVRNDDPDGNPWGVEFSTMFHMTNDSHLFRTAEELRAEGAVLEGNIWRRGTHRWLPLYEAKMVGVFDHRAADVVISKTALVRQGQPDAIDDLGHIDPCRLATPRQWVAETDVRSAMRNPNAKWLAGFRDITSATNERTLIAAVFPKAAVGNKLPLLMSDCKSAALLACVLSAAAHDYTARQKLGGTTLNFFIAKQLAVLDPDTLDAPCEWSSGTTAGWLTPRTLELTYTAWDLVGFAADLGYHGPPFRWDPARRELLRAELDAAFFHLYGIERDDVDYIMDTFPIVRRKDESAHGEYRTKRLILERYDALAEAVRTGVPYQTVLDPPPAHPSCAHDPSTRPSWADLWSR